MASMPLCGWSGGGDDDGGALFVNVVSHEPAERRPIASRRLGWVRATASWLVRRGISPNAISASSTIFAGLAGLALLGTEWNAVGARLLWVAAALGIQLRLLANLFDGMVALESGKASAVGELFNEVPDRLSDAAILIALGFLAGSSIHLGYLAALLAVFVAYLRSMGAVAGAGQAFAGVMSKPRRMFVVTVLCLHQAITPATWLAARDPWMEWGAVGWTLGVIVVGCVVTAWTRLAAIARTLRGRHA